VNSGHAVWASVSGRRRNSVAKFVVVILAALIVCGCGNATDRRNSSGTRLTSVHFASYCAYGDRFTSVTATWVQPRMMFSSYRKARVSFWVGLDGFHSHMIEQIGTEGYSEGSRTAYDAWYEMYPKRQRFIYGMNVRPGDRFTATVTSNGRGSFTLKLVNHSTGVTRVAVQRVADAKLASAEVTAEAPSPNLTQWTLAYVRSVRFTSCAVNGRPLTAFHLARIDLVASDGSYPLMTSPLGDGGTSFSVTHQ
jgi:hypothetical protein